MLFVINLSCFAWHKLRNKITMNFSMSQNAFNLVTNLVREKERKQHRD